MWFLNFCLLFSLAISPVISTCYYPNGDTAKDIACDSSASASACCGTGYSCLSNGICLRTSLATDGQNGVTYVRGSCTDQTWNSTLCPNFCDNPDAPFKDNMKGGQSMGRCENQPDDIYFCGDSNLAAVNCTQNVNVVSFAGQPSIITIIGQVTNTASTTRSSVSPTKETISSTTATSSSLATTSNSTTTVSTSSSSAASTSSTQSPTSTSAPKKDNGVAIGVGVGLSVGVVILGLAAGFFWYGHRKGKRSVEYLNTPAPIGQGKDPKESTTYYSPVPPSELPQHGEAPPNELPQSPGFSHDTRRASELPGTSNWATLEGRHKLPPTQYHR